VLALVAGAGVPVAAHLGWIRLEAALSDQPWPEVVLFASARAVFEGSLLMAVLMVVGSGIQLDTSELSVALVGPRVLAPVLSGLAFTAFVWAVGLFVFGLIAVPLVAPIVAVWRVVVRLLFLRAPARSGTS
jgi:hypothetical protein